MTKHTPSTFCRVLMRRDSLTEDEARAAWEEVHDYLNDLLESAPIRFAAYSEFETYLREEWGLEPDYMMEFI